MPTVKNGLYKRGDSWYIMYRLDNKQIRKSYGPDRKAAEFALNKVKSEISRGRAFGDWGGLEELVTPKSKKTFGEAARAYIDERANNKASTIISYKDILKVLLPVFGDVEIRKITEEHVAKFQAGLQKQDLSPRRVNNIIQLLRSVLKVSVRRKVISDNPADGVDRVRAPKAVIDPLTREELEKALEHIDAHFRPLFTCLAWTGARPSELLALRWDDVEWERNQIKITKARVRGQEGLPKTRSSERQIPILPPVLEALNELNERPSAIANGYVFMTKKGDPIGKHLDRIWAKGLQKAGLKARPSYQLRHTFASLSLQKGADPGYISKILGHGSMQITFEYYLRFIPDKNNGNEKLLVSMFDKSDQNVPDRK